MVVSFSNAILLRDVSTRQLMFDVLLVQESIKFGKTKLNTSIKMEDLDHVSRLL